MDKDAAAAAAYAAVWAARGRGDWDAVRPLLKVAADLGHGDALREWFDLVWREEKEDVLRKGAAAGHVACTVELWKDSDGDEMAEEVQQLADGGNLHAQATLERDEDVQRDLLRAAADGDMWAALDLAQLGDGPLMRQLATKGLPEAQFQLGVWLWEHWREERNVGPRDAVEAKHWMRLAARQGSGRACWWLAKLLFNNEQVRDWREAAMWAVQEVKLGGWRWSYLVDRLDVEIEPRDANARLAELWIIGKASGSGGGRCGSRVFRLPIWIVLVWRRQAWWSG